MRHGLRAGNAMSLETAFMTIYGREPKPEETNQFNRLAKELGIRENDAVWSIVFLLGHHRELAEKIPERMREQSNHALAAFDAGVQQRSQTAEKELRAIKARIEETISTTVVTSCEKEIACSAQSVARVAAATSLLQWLGVASCVGMVFLGTAFYWSNENGKRIGYASALDVKEA
jgi:DNA anti-recombination protein RmuC